MPVNKKPGESKEEFIGRCIGIEINNGHPQDQAVAMCYAQYDEQNLKAVSNIRNQKYKEDKWIVKFFENNEIGMSIKEMGLTLEDFYNPKYQQKLTEADLEMLPMELFAEEDYITVYKYVSDTYGSKGYGPNSRPFCVTLMKQKDSVFTMSDIAELNNAPGKANRAGGGGYSVFKYAGGNFCKHYWARYLYDTTTKELIEKTFIQPKKATDINRAGL